MKEQNTLESPMPPLWMIYPNITKYSIGWRMGYGEGYKWDFVKWFKKLSEKDQKKYKIMFPQPKFWEDNSEECYGFIPFWEKGGEMKYSIKELLKRKDFNELEYVFFWKADATQNNQFCLSQWHTSLFEVDIDDYCCTEQYMMAEKARLFEDDEICEKILKSKNPAEMQILGKKVKNFKQDIWVKVKYSIVLNGNYFKFTQNKEIRDYLLSTGNKILVEASPKDKIWGIGLDENHPDANKPIAWRGKNLLGFALMELRDELRRVYKNYDKIDWDKLKKYL